MASVETKLLIGKIDYNVANDCKYYLLFCCYSSSEEKFKNRLLQVTNVEPKYLSQLQIIDINDVVDEVPKWFVDFNTGRYNGEGVYKDFQVYN